jgi:hypothetical protein
VGKVLFGMILAVGALVCIRLITLPSAPLLNNQTAAEGDVSSAPVRTVSALQLWSDYHANEVAADNVYRGERLDVQGVVESINKNFVDDVYVVLATPNEFMSVHADLKHDYQSAAAQLQIGQMVSLECVGGGMVIGSPILKDCSFIPLRPKPSPEGATTWADPTLYQSNPTKPDADVAPSADEVSQSQVVHPAPVESQSATASDYPCDSNGVCRIGKGVTTPVPIVSSEAEFSDEARQQKLQGVVLVS